MGKQGEIDYLRNNPSHVTHHAYEKPFSDPRCGAYLRDLADFIDLLPPTPARVLDLGCGSGWTSVFFARRGYEVVGQDVCPDMIALAEKNRQRAGAERLRFQVSDYEELAFSGEFDAAVFNESLHHAVDERAALLCAWRALKPGGICITNEPGEGHADEPYSRNAVARLGVTEKDMPPRKVIQLGKEIGFRTYRVCVRFVSPKIVYDDASPRRALRAYGEAWWNLSNAVRQLLFGLKQEMTASNIVVLTK